MMDDLESRTLLSATLTSADPDEGGEIATAIYAPAGPTTSADPDEGGEVTAKVNHSSLTIMKTFDKASPILFKACDSGTPR